MGCISCFWIMNVNSKGIDIGWLCQRIWYIFLWPNCILTIVNVHRGQFKFFNIWTKPEWVSIGNIIFGHIKVGIVNWRMNTICRPNFTFTRNSIVSTYFHDNSQAIDIFLGGSGHWLILIFPIKKRLWYILSVP